MFLVKDLCHKIVVTFLWPVLYVGEYSLSSTASRNPFVACDLEMSKKHLLQEAEDCLI
jgi:hypothetical protein